MQSEEWCGFESPCLRMNADRTHLALLSLHLLHSLTSFAYPFANPLVSGTCYQTQSHKRIHEYNLSHAFSNRLFDMSESNSSGSSATGIAIGVSIAIVSLVSFGVGFYFWHRRRRAQGPAQILEDTRRQTTMVVDPNHLAAQVTPYTPTQEVPLFSMHLTTAQSLCTETRYIAHRPGENMRVARRRSDGGWEFSDPLTIKPPTLPYAESVYSVQSSPTSSICKKEKLPGELTTRGYIEYDIEGVPPPAYDAMSDGHSSYGHSSYSHFSYGPSSSYTP